MSQLKWVFIMVMIVIVALGILVVLLLYDGGFILPASQTAAPTTSPTDELAEATETPSQTLPSLTPSGTPYIFQVYDDAPVHYGDIAYMGSDNDGDDGAMTINPACADDPHSGGSCIQITYAPPSPSHWAGMMWLSGANNFPPNLPVDGVDTAQADRLTFYARGLGSTKFFIENEEKQQVTLSVRLTPDWTQYTIALPSDWLNVCVGFGFASSGAGGDNTLYLDDIAFSN